MQFSAMTLGTVQLGMNYGIANNAGKPSEETSFSILRSALENGVMALLKKEFARVDIPEIMKVLSRPKQ